MAMGAAVFERLADWSPIFDLAVAAIGSRELGPKSQRPSLYVTSGRQPYGAVTELRYGSGADTIIEMDASGLLGMASATGLWALPTGNDQETIVFFSSPGHTAILYLSETLEAEPVNDIGDYADGATVLAVLVMDRHILHIMEHSIFVGVFGPTEPPPDPMAIIRFPDSKILCAAYTKRVIIVAVQEQDAAFLQVYALGERLGTEDIRLIAQPFRLDSDPTCLVLFENQQNDSLYAALGLRNGLIHLFAIDHTTGLHHRHAHYIMHSSLQPFQTFIAESIAVLSHPKRANDLLVCGLRDGRLYVAEVLVRDNETVLQTSTITQLGEGPLRLSQAGTRSSVAFATCGSDTFRVGFDPGFEGEGLSLSNVWFYNTQTHDQHQPAMSSFCALWSDADGNATLGGLDKSVLLIAQVWSELRVIPRRLPLDVEDLNDTSDNSVGTPIKIHYSSYLDAMVIGSVRYEWVPPTSPETRHAAWKGKRRSRGVLQIMPSAKVHGEEVAAESTVVDLDPGELVKSIAELTLDLGGTRWHFLLVGTSFQPKDDDPGGRVFFFESARTKDGGVRLETRKISDLDRPVTAIASYDKTKFVLCTDNKLSVYELTVVSGRFKWKQLCSTPLLSSGLHITAAPPLIYVSTASDSLQVFTLAKDDTADTSGVKLERSFSDSRARDAECHLLVSLPWGETGQQFRNPLGLHEEPVDECPDLVLVADRAGGIAGLLHPKARANQYAVPTVFEGKLLQSVTRLVQADIRPPWRRIEDLKASGVLVDNIIGSTTDGTVYSFTIVNEELWCVLKYLENLVKKVKWMHTDLPEGDLNTPSAIDPEREFLTPLRQRKGGSHINGDLLERLLAEDGLDLLIDAIELARVANSVKSDSEPKPDSSSTDSEPEQHTSSWEKYPSGNWEDVAQIFMAHVRKTTDKQIDSLEEAAEQAMHLLRRLLQPTL
ncbi:hypothetical protein EJ06DRAFT_372773 [Trichodelitschia bisporula]|uniref:Cleavage/polyadenylation specificity factor A subunit N-terminal domain-containing protein n=1 Tax=Trichodelitschia bisporula TaxID=703511 RepID=A0A6G1I1V1_9PEZI|nr:hypothetical protein EJ06DRAFT_372773 [Trichodelitschia bisporula]